MATIFRIENELGQGPYTSGDIPPALDDPEIHPLPDDDGIEGGMSVYELCGFVSLEALHEWFTDDIIGVLKDCERYTIQAYDVPDSAVRLGRRQAVFDQYKTLEITTVESLI